MSLRNISCYSENAGVFVDYIRAFCRIFLAKKIKEVVLHKLQCINEHNMRMSADVISLE